MVSPDVIRVSIYEALWAPNPGSIGLSEPDLSEHLRVKFDRALDPDLISKAIAALILDHHISVVVGILAPDQHPVYDRYGTRVDDHPVQLLHGWRKSDALGPIVGPGTDDDPYKRWCDICEACIAWCRLNSAVGLYGKHVVNSPNHPEGQTPRVEDRPPRTLERAVLSAIRVNQDNVNVPDGGDPIDIIVQARSLFTTPTNADDLLIAIGVMRIRNRIEFARIVDGRQHYIIAAPSSEPHRNRAAPVSDRLPSTGYAELRSGQALAVGHSLLRGCARWV